MIRRRSVWVGRATLATVGGLLLLLGASLRVVPPSELAREIPVAVAFAALLLGLTAGFLWLFVRWSGRAPPRPAERSTAPRRFPVELAFIAAVVAGYLLLGSQPVSWGAPLEGALYILLALVAFDLDLSREGLRTIWRPLGAAVVAAPIAALVMVLAGTLEAPVAFATAFGFGWYSLAGPLVAAKAGALLGLVAFLTNFLRENITMLSAPRVGPRLGGEGIAALGGATSMDTTLYFAVRYGSRSSATTALGTGLILTVTAGLVLPWLLSLPGA